MRNGNIYIYIYMRNGNFITDMRQSRTQEVYRRH